jgi:hypothetical protein
MESDVQATIDGILAIGVRLRRMAQERRDEEAVEALTELLVAADGLKVAVANLLREQPRPPSPPPQQSPLAAQARSGLRLRRGAYYAPDAPKGEPTGPFCVDCADQRGRLVLLRPAPGLAGVYGCPECKKLIDVTSYTP